MATLTIDGVTVTAKGIDEANEPVLVKLRQVTGWNLKALAEKSEELEIYGMQAQAWVSFWMAGQAVDWERIRQLSLRELTPAEEPGDRGTPEADAADPQHSRADSDPGGEARLEAAAEELPSS